MKILDTKLLYQSSRTTLNQFKNLTYNNYYLMKESGSKSILGLLNMFSEQDIIDSIKSLQLDEDRVIVTPNQTRQDVILRYLEYGGEAISAPHLLTKSIMFLKRRKLNNV